MYVQGLTGIESAIVSDVEITTRAYIAAVEQRETGRPFYGMVLAEEPRSRAILHVSASLAAQVPDLDMRRAVIEKFCSGTLAINKEQTSQSLWSTVDTSQQQVTGEFVTLCDALLVRSHAEYARLLPSLKRPRRFEPVVVEPVIPAFERVLPKRPAVVVWAPERPSALVTVHALSLLDFLGDVTFVTSDGAALAGYRGDFVRVGRDLPEILARACCVLCVDPDDPGAAVAFARRGVGVVAPLTSGAHEFVRDVVPFDMGDFRSILTAVQIAVAQPASVRAIPAPPPFPGRPPLPASAELPLVSVVLCTYNRREDVTRALSCLQAQTYPNVEVVVVNDAGENVDDVIARFPRARPHNLPVNGGVLRAIGEGLRQARGEYIQVLADDDWLEPDHVEAIVGAMLRTGASIAHANTMIRYQELVPGAEPKTTGFNTVVFNETTTPTDALIATPVAGQSIIFRRDMLDEIGSWREDCILADQEFQLRAANRYVMVYVDRVTSEWRARGTDNLSSQTDSSVELRRIYEVLHPLPDRPVVERRRVEALANVSGRTPGVFAFPPTLYIGPA